MPWTVADVDKHSKGLSDKQKRAWVAVANSARDRCMKADGADGTACDASAIKQANAIAAKVHESDDFTLLEIGKTISKKTRGAIQGAMDALAALLKDEQDEGEPTAAASEAAPLPLDDSHDALRMTLSRAIADRARKDAPSNVPEYQIPYPFIRDVFDAEVVYDLGGETYRCTYSVNGDGPVTLGDPSAVDVAYVDAGEAAAALIERQYTTDQRKAMASKGHAMPDGSFPIATVADLENAIRAIGRASDPAAAKAHIRTRAKALGAEDKLPADWKEAAVPAPDCTSPPKPRGDETLNPAAESADAELVGDLVPLVEKAVRTDGTTLLKVIAPGWGSSGYYSPALLKRDGPVAFRAGTHMYLDHPTASEESERPERSVRDLGGTLTSDASWRDVGPAGPGLYAEARVRNDLAPLIEELAPHIGVSIRALGRASQGEMDGRSGPIIEKLVAGRSVDFVTAPGAGGRIVQLFEAARGGRGITTPPQGGATVDEQEARALREAMSGLETQNRDLGEQVNRMREALLLRDVRDTLAATLRELDMPDMTRQRLFESLQPRAPIKDGALDREAFGVQIREAVKAELAYLAQATGAGSGLIRGMGSTGAPSDDSAATDSLNESLIRLMPGVPADAVRLAANGRGR